MHILHTDIFPQFTCCHPCHYSLDTAERACAKFHPSFANPPCHSVIQLLTHVVAHTRLNLQGGERLSTLSDTMYQHSAFGSLPSDVSVSSRVDPVSASSTCHSSSAPKNFISNSPSKGVHPPSQAWRNMTQNGRARLSNYAGAAQTLLSP